MKTTMLRRVPEQEFPGTLPIEQQLRFLLRYAVLAPSARNAQPWHFAVDGATVHLSADRSHWQTVADPDQRELYLSLGCALENLLAAAEHFGLRHDVTYLPDPADPALAAIVTVGPGGTRAPARAGFGLDHLLDRRTAHGPFLDQAIPVAALRALERAALDEDVVVRFSEAPGRRSAVERLHAAACERLFARPEYRGELADVIGGGDLGTPWPLSRLGRLAVSSERVARRIGQVELEGLHGAPLLVLVGTAADDRRAQVKSGQVLERIWLTATALGLGLRPMSAALEVPELRAGLGPVFGLPAGFVAQELVRIGWPAGHRGFRTPRRPAGDVLGG